MEQHFEPAFCCKSACSWQHLLLAWGRLGKISCCYGLSSLLCKFNDSFFNEVESSSQSASNTWMIVVRYFHDTVPEAKFQSDAWTFQHLFAENKEKLIQSALQAMISKDFGEDLTMIEQQFHAIRRLVASKAGFSGFTTLSGFREKVLHCIVWIKIVWKLALSWQVLDGFDQHFQATAHPPLTTSVD